MTVSLGSFTSWMVGSTSCAIVLTTMVAGTAGSAPVAIPATTALMGSVAAASGAEPVVVSARIWPTNAVMSSKEVGQDIPLLNGSVQIAGGDYLVNIDPASLPASHMNTDKSVDLEVTVDQGASSETYFETVIFVGGTWVSKSGTELETAAARAAEASAVPRHDFAVGASQGRVAATADSGATLTAEAAAIPVCSPRVVDTFKRPVKISDVMPSPSGMTGRVIFKSGSDQKIGVAVNGNVSGTVTMESSATFTPNFQTGDKTAWTQYTFREMTRCGRPGHTIKPTRHEGGQTYTTRGRPSYSHCQLYSGGGTWSSARGKAWEYAAGADLKGTSVTAQTGYSTLTLLEYKFAASKSLCGNNVGPASAQLVMGR